MRRFPHNVIHPLDTDNSHPCSSTQCQQGNVATGIYKEIPKHYCCGVSNISEMFLIILSAIFGIFLFPFSLPLMLSYIPPFQTAIVLRLGRVYHRHYYHGEYKSGGLLFLLPFTDKLLRVDMRIRHCITSVKSAITTDGITLNVNAVVFYHVEDPLKAAIVMEDIQSGIQNLFISHLNNCISQTTLENILSNLDENLLNFDQNINSVIHSWGIKVDRLEIKDIILPEDLMRSLTSHAEAVRETRAKKILADSDALACQYLLEAAQSLQENSVAVELRNLYAMKMFGSQGHMTIVAPTIFSDMIFQLPCFDM